MDDNKTLEILKQAILLERRGKAFYSNVAAQAQDADVKAFFETMASEEDDHIRFLNEQFESYLKNHQFNSQNLEMPMEDGTAEQILSDKVKAKIGAASFEAAAIAAAIDFETRAVAVYGERAKTATDPQEQQFYQFLAKWESGHHKILIDIDNELKENIWHDNQFWPF